MVLKVEGTSGSGVRLQSDIAGTQHEINGTHILAAAGRLPNTTGMGLDKADVLLGERGYVRVNEALAASAPDVWAMEIVLAVCRSPINSCIL